MEGQQYESMQNDELTQPEVEKNESIENQKSASEEVAFDFLQTMENMEQEPKVCENGPGCPCVIQRGPQEHLKAMKLVLDSYRGSNSLA